MEMLDIVDHAVYDAQPQDILNARRAIRIESARIAKVERNAARAAAGLPPE